MFKKEKKLSMRINKQIKFRNIASLHTHWWWIILLFFRLINKRNSTVGYSYQIILFDRRRYKINTILISMILINHFSICRCETFYNKFTNVIKNRKLLNCFSIYRFEFFYTFTNVKKIHTHTLLHKYTIMGRPVLKCTLTYIHTDVRLLSSVCINVATCKYV